MGRKKEDDWSYYDYRPTIKAKGGIKAQSKRGQFGASWWARRWIAMLESFDMGGRLGRGRSYACRGQVLAIEIASGMIKAKVQGSFPKPYNVMIKVKLLPEGDWKKMAAALSSQAIFAAKLLAGEMPQEIEEAFVAVGLSLFPEKLRDLETSCSCPDWSNPCKHIAAVYYLPGEEFDRDPFLIFKLRSMNREELLDAMSRFSQTKHALTKAEPEAEKRAKRGKRKDAALTVASTAPASEPLTANPESFWNGGTLPEDFFGAVNLPPVTAALLRRLGSFSFWRGEQLFIEALEPAYSQAAPRGLEIFVGSRQTRASTSQQEEKSRGRE
jgi:uncharacterized Zn finger protein